VVVAACAAKIPCAAGPGGAAGVATGWPIGIRGACDARGAAGGFGPVVGSAGTDVGSTGASSRDAIVPLALGAGSGSAGGVSAGLAGAPADGMADGMAATGAIAGWAAAAGLASIEAAVFCWAAAIFLACRAGDTEGAPSGIVAPWVAEEGNAAG